MQRFSRQLCHQKGKTQIPGGAPEKVVGLPVHELRSELAHLLFHFPHFRVEPLPDVAEFSVDHAEVAQFDGDVSFDGHFVGSHYV